MLVAPDQVGSQSETLRRLARYSRQLALIAETAATLLLPLQVGTMTHAEFLRAAEVAAGIPLVPAMPMRKAATLTTALVEFVQELKPRHIHLLGMGIENRRAPRILRLMRHFSPETSVSLDSNRIRAVSGAARPLTLTEAAMRSSTAEGVYSEVIASPSWWCTRDQFHSIAGSVGLLPHESAEFGRDPDNFLQTPFPENTEISWMEYPLMEVELNRAWEDFLNQTIHSSIRTAAIVRVFQDSAIPRCCA
jgi:hypothetical protein